MFNFPFYRQVSDGFSQSFYKPSRFYIDFVSGSYEKTDETAVTVTIRRNFLGAATVRLYVSGGKEAGEDFGLGKNFTGSGTWVNDDYELNYTVVSFGAAEDSKEVTITVFKNLVLEMDRVMTLSLANPSNGVIIGDPRTISIVDDQIPETGTYRNIIDVTRPNTDFDSGATYDRGLGAKALDNTGNSNILENLQDQIDWLNANGGGILYFPNGTYLHNQIGTDAYVNPYWNQSYIGESKEGVIFKRQNIQSVGNLVGITRANPAVVTLPSGHGLQNASQIIFTTLTGDWAALNWDAATETGYSWKIANLSGDTCNIIRSGASYGGGNLNSSTFSAYVPNSDPVYVQYKYHKVFHTGTDYSHAADDSAPMAFANLTFNGNSLNQGPWKDFELEQSPCISLNGDTASVGLLVAKCDNLHFYDCVAGAIKPNGNLDLNVYEITKENGNIWNIMACACPATDTLKVTGKNITGTATRTGEEPGFSTENIEGKVQIDLYNLNIAGDMSLNTNYTTISADSHINITGGSLVGDLLIWNNNSAAANIPVTIQGTSGDLFLLNCPTGDIRVSNGGSILFDYTDFGGNANLQFVKVAGSTGSNGTIEFKRSILRTSATKYREPYSPETVNGYYAAPPVSSATAGESGYVYKLTSCEFINDLVDQTVVMAVPHIRTNALGVWKTVIDDCDFPATFTHGVRRYVYALGTGVGGEYELKNLTANCGILAHLDGTATNQIKVTQDTVTLGAGCEYNYDFRVPNTNSLAGYLNNTNVTVHPDCKVRLNYPIRPAYHFTITGYRTITEGSAPTVQYPHGIYDDKYVYDGTNYECDAWVYLDDAAQMNGTWTAV